MNSLEQIKEKHGLFKNVPKFVRTIVRKRLSELEAEETNFSRAVLENRSALKRLYALLHVKPSPHAQALLFDNNPPPNSPIEALRQLTRLNNPEAAAALVRQHRLPFLQVESALGNIPPAVGLALIEVLAADELIARLPLFAKRDLITGELRTALLLRLLAIAKAGETHISYQQAEALVRSAKLERELASAVFALVLQKATSQTTLSGDTALIVDTSSSMPREGDCLEIAAQVGKRLDAAMASNTQLTVVLTNQNATTISVRFNSDLGVWRTALTVPVTEAAAGSSLGAAVELLTAERRAMRRLVFVTDGYENYTPRLAGAIFRYRETIGIYPNVCLVQPPESSPQLAIDLKNAQIDYSVFAVDRYFEGLDGMARR